MAVSGVTLSFGLINVLVSVVGAVSEDRSRSMHNVCLGHKAVLDAEGKEIKPAIEHTITRTKQKLVCPVCENDDAEQFAKAQDAEGGDLVLIPTTVIKQDREHAADKKKAIDVTAHPLEEVTSVLMPSGKSYYLDMKVQTPGQREAYTTLSTIIASNPEFAFMCKHSLRSAVSLFQVTVAGSGVLVLRQMADAALVRKAPSIDFMELSEFDQSMARMLVQGKVQPFLVEEHGTGNSSIIAEYALGQTPMTPINADGVAVAGQSDSTVRSAVSAMLAEAAAQADAAAAAAATTTPIATVTKKAVARKTTARKTAAVKKAS